MSQKSLPDCITWESQCLWLFSGGNVWQLFLTFFRIQDRKEHTVSHSFFLFFVDVVFTLSESRMFTFWIKHGFIRSTHRFFHSSRKTFCFASSYERKTGIFFAFALKKRVKGWKKWRRDLCCCQALLTIAVDVRGLCVIQSRAFVRRQCWI